MRRSALIGFTEAELGFVIAAVVAFTAAAEVRSANVEVQKRVVLSEVKDLHLPVVLSEKPVVLTAPTAKPRPAWASDLLRRSCSEVEGKQLRRSPIDVIDVDGIDRYRVGNELLTLRELEARLAHSEAEAQANMCRYTLQFRPGRAVGARELLVAEEPFQGRFYREHRLR